MEKTKIDIISMDAVPNYGSVLQAFATRLFFEKKGCDVRFIDYARENVRYDRLLQSWSSGNLVKMVIMFPTITRWKKVFGDFRKRYLNLTEKQFTTEEDFKNYILRSDAYCTGSDQVWNSKWNNGIIPPLYLSFVPNDKYKFAFSASFGQSELSDDEVIATKPYIDSYKYISVREQSGKKILENQYGYPNATHLIDPTLMLTAEEWRKYSSKKIEKNDYILIYNLNKSKEFDNYAKKLANKTGLKLFRFCTRYDQFFRSGKSLAVPFVFDFISYIDNARYVLTDSFHATAFFFFFLTEPICVYPNEFSSRIEDFLTLTDSLQRHIHDYNDFDVLERSVDFDKVNNILDAERKKASDWVDVVLKDIKKEK